MKPSFLFVLFFSLFFTACKNTQTEAGQTVKDQLMKLHDEVMPQTMKISEIKKQLTEASETKSADLQTKAQAISSRLQKAEDDMYVWMDELGKIMNDAKEEKSKLLEYGKLLKSVSQIKKDTESALKDAKDYLNEVKK
jgi:predicted  nucleic acid-binding Zn-ribbon protein